MTLASALALLGLLLAVLAFIPTLRDYFLLNAAVICVALAVVLQSGIITL